MVNVTLNPTSAGAPAKTTVTWTVTVYGLAELKK